MGGVPRPRLSVLLRLLLILKLPSTLLSIEFDLVVLSCLGAMNAGF